jgi:putative acetyltransferase
MTDTDLTIRPSTPADTSALEALYAAAFPEEDLVPQMRALLAEPDGVISLVAQHGGAVAGHVAFTLCRVEGPDALAALLGPLCAAPDRQGRGIGSALVKAGLERLRADGVTTVLVLGDPAYYGRFGFAAGHDIAAPYDLPAEYAAGWQSLSLDPDTPLPQGRLKRAAGVARRGALAALIAECLHGAQDRLSGLPRRAP